MPKDTLESYLLGERRICFKIFAVVQNTIKGLEQAVAGLVTNQAISNARQILNGALPSSWERAYPDGPENPVDYLQRVSLNAKYLLAASKFH